MPSAKTDNIGWTRLGLTVLSTAVLIGVAWGNVNSRLIGMENRVGAYENQIVTLLEDLRNDTGDNKVKLAEVARDVEWIKEKIANE